VINLRTIVLAASVFALLPLGAMAASTDTSGGNAPASTSTTHHKKPVHHVAHKTHKPKTPPSNTQG
jgi:hypothetical protein